jgi:CheY-like chemotaxis protein
MEKSVQARIYDPFFTTKNTEQNSGLGLSIVHRAVHAHGGWIELESAPGEGATFDIYLPALSDEIVARSMARSPSSEVRRQASERILVLEDEDGLRESIQDVLERQGYCVEACEDLASARSAFREASFDLILTDVRLPDGRGTKLVADALARDPNVGCILMSGYTQNEEDSEVLPFSRTSFLHKPFSLDDLLDSVRKQLDRR